jgi:energy-coupling factor transport system ATP-binding protein
VSAALEIRDLFRVYSGEGTGSAALQGLALDVEEGEICVVLGPSGSGKTTLLRILAGLDRPSAGAVRAFRTEIGRMSASERAAYRARVLGYAEQHYWRALSGELSARELVALQLGLAGERRSVRLNRADELLERVGLLDRRDAHPGELSGGEQQRVAVCAALAHRPRLFLADEPTGELDAQNAAIVYRLIGELVREEGTTAVIVSHDPQSASIADRIVRVRDGRVSEEAARTDGNSEAIVVGKGGWLRLSEELLRRAGIGSRAAARVAGEGIVVTPVGTVVREPDGDGVVPPPRSPGPGRVVAEARSVTKSYASARALAELSASFRAGRLTAVTGPSGSGKTTLLHLLAGLDLPSAGDVAVDGSELSALNRRERAELRRRRIALVGQEPGLVPFLTAVEIVALGLDLRGRSGDDATDFLRDVGLAERAGERVSVLSAGERERVAIARALAARPALLLADEPTARLDQANALAVASLFSRLARDYGTAIVCATHDPLMIEQADDVIALDG